MTSTSTIKIETDRRQNLIGGQWQPPANRRYIDVEDPYHERPIGLVPASTADDVDDALAAATAAMPSWSAMSGPERADHLDAVRGALSARVEDFATCWAREVGIPLTVARAATSGLPVAVLESAAALARTMPWDEQLAHSTLVRRPVGVVGVITPWNYPLSQIVIKSTAALAAGCTVIAKPSEVAPLCAFGFADLTVEAGLPPGVFNLVSGDGLQAGSPLAADRRIGAVSFTGSTATGAHVMAAAATNITRVCLELGGKSASLVLDDGVLEAAVESTVASCMRNSGQTCTSLTRLIVKRSFAGEATSLAAELADAYVLGDPLDPATTLGPIISANQLDRVRGYIWAGVRSGATLVTGGADAPPGPDHGYFVKPTVFGDVDPASPIAQEEIFGPVLSIIVVDDDDEAVRVANAVDYGLAGAVWGSDADRAMEIARRLDTGSVSINGGTFNPEAPYGGLKRSGIGYELGRFGIEEFLTTRVLNPS
ncbi:MAG: aldehyde dehydrogenase family protein [Ilumatobacter sp.]|uniref:aldehyde dehydrogenase family protein n=1 Tax=Ilumatobacter sp. TaxID=1967498 RepID=UPI003919669B